jgi:glucosyl-3-phosphoglycerate phosphatase
MLPGRIFIARHGETVFNAAQIMQGQHIAHTPLTRKGFDQANAMGVALGKWLGTRQSISMWASDSGRAQQTLAIMAEHIGCDFHETRFDKRLREIDVGDWSGRKYSDIVAEIGPIVDTEAGLFNQRPPNGEYYDDVAARLKSWMEDTGDDRGDRLVVMHGISARVLRALQRQLPVDPQWGAPMAHNVAQGTLIMVGYDSEEKIIHQGQGVRHA